MQPACTPAAAAAVWRAPQTRAARRAAARPPRCRAAAADAPREGGVVITVCFADTDVCVDGAPGESLLAVAARAGVPLPSKCRSGSCGTCEVELTVSHAPGGARGGDALEAGVARACVTRLPRAAAAVTVALFRDDDVWGA